VFDAARLSLSALGAALIGYGAWLHYPPLGFMAGGALLFSIGVLGALRAR
jgi:hypothetical protein